MAIAQCVWLDSASDIASVFPDDLVLDGTKSWKIGDMVLIAEPAGIAFYSLVEFAATQINESGVIVSGQWSVFNAGYPVFYKTVFSYSMQSILIDVNSSSRTIGCASGAEAADLCTLMESIPAPKDSIFSLVSPPSTLVISPSYSKYINATTELDYLEDASAQLVWQPDKVEVNMSEGTGSPMELVTSGTLTLNGKLWGVKKNEEYWVEAEQHTSGSFVKVRHMTQGGVMSTISTVSYLVTPGSDDTYPTMAMSPLTADLVAVGYGDYTGSKPEQGIIQLWDVDASYNLTNGRTVSPPVPARYGQFGGYAIGLCNVDDGTYGADLHLITGNIDDIVILRQSNSFATEHQVIALDRNDTLVDIWCGKNKIALRFYDDSTGKYCLSFYHYNGSSWTLIQTTYAYEASATTGSGAFVDDAAFVIYHTASSRTEYFELTSTAAYMRGSMHYTPYGTPRGGHVAAMHGDRRVATWVSSTKTVHIFELPAGSAPVLKMTGVDVVAQTICYRLYASLGPSDEERIYGVFPVIGMAYFEGVPGTVPQVYAGKHLFSSNNDDARLLLDDGVTEILDASISVAQPALGKIRFAISYDDGTTWYVWQSGVGYQALTALTDLKTTTYGDHSLFEVAVQGLDVVNNKKISFAYCIDRDDPSIDAEINSSIASLTYHVNYPAETEYTLRVDTNNYINANINVSDNVAVVVSGQEYQMAFFDDMT